MISVNNNIFHISTKTTSYIFEVNKADILEHLYYGKKIKECDVDFLRQKREFEPGSTVLLEKQYPGFSLEDALLEMSSTGKGDIREPMIKIVHSDGSLTSDFRYLDYKVDNVKEGLKTLPSSYGECNHLLVRLLDRSYNITLELHYYAFEKEDVITKTVRIINTSNDKIHVDRCLSNQLDLFGKGYKVTNFTGAWIREMERNDTILNAGKFINACTAGISSNRCNPFTMLSKTNTDEDNGDCYGFNLIYSGDHYTAFEVNSFEKTRVVSGINPQEFSFLLEPGADFEAPEAIMTYASHGYNELSEHLHEFIRKHILRGEWKDKQRPILLNSWEACYFSINEEKMVELAKKAKEAGIELIVMDDGWYGKRNDDHSSLGDWFVNKEKLPNGLKGLTDKLDKIGIDFGIWVEPEMISEDSDLYRAHPEWALEIPNMPHSEGRNQRILDLGRTDVQNYLLERLSAIFNSANIKYCKWDMNRIFSDRYSQNLNPEHQKETVHRYQIGLYRIMKEITERYPHILFEGCASGGDRFDLGILSYFPQIWTSDNTDAYVRSKIQNDVSYGYPQITYTCHVSDVPNHQTMRSINIDTRYNVANFGCLGYELNLCKLNDEDFEVIKKQVAQYKKNRKLLQFGQMYRVKDDERVTEWTVVSKDKKDAIGLMFEKLSKPNWSTEIYMARGLDENILYHFSNHMMEVEEKKADNITLQNDPSQFAKQKDLKEIEDYDVYGDGLMNNGVLLKQSFAGTGFNANMRMAGDFVSRLYFMKAK